MPEASRRGEPVRAGGADGRIRSEIAGVAGTLSTALIDLVVTKPIAVLVWWLSTRANRMDFQDRADLRRRVATALRAGRPVLFASNHLSMFDDPILPMALYRTGERALAELSVLAGLVALWLAAPRAGLPPALPGLAAIAWTVSIALFGSRKVWWSLGDLVNFSGASALRSKIEAAGDSGPSRLHRVLLAVADPAIYHFMRSSAVRTVFVDRRAGEQARRARAGALDETLEIAARAEAIWVFFEGGRAMSPFEIAPARRGIGDLILGLRARGLDPLVIALRHRGLEAVLPRGSSRWLDLGHRIEVQWHACDLENAAGGGDAQAVADAVRREVAHLQPGKSGACEGSHGVLYRFAATVHGWGVFLTGCLLWGILLVPPTLLLYRLWPGLRVRFADATRRFLRFYVGSLLFARFEVEGAAQRLRGPRIVVVNHQSWLDPIVLIGLEPGLGGPVRNYIYRTPVLGSIVRLLGFYPVDVGEKASLEQLHRSAEIACEQGTGLLFFPEGTRSRTGEIGPFHRGAFRAAVDHALPIQPVVIDGLDRVLPPGHAVAQMPGRYPVRIRYLAPITPPFGRGPRREVVRSLSDRVREALVEALDELRDRARRC